MKKFEYIEGLTTADVAFLAWGKTPGELFVNCANALMQIMIEKQEQISQTQEEEIHLEAKNLEQLLHDFLEELIFLKDAKLLIFSKFQIKITQNLELTAKCAGEKINNKKHSMLVDAKAITWHHFKLEKIEEDVLRATVVVDV